MYFYTLTYSGVESYLNSLYKRNAGQSRYRGINSDVGSAILLEIEKKKTANPDCRDAL